MDKSKKRTDLLDAGRKKLQQFRQKNSKGNSSKSSKAGRSGSGATAGTVPESAARHQNIADSQISGVDVEHTVSYSESTSRIDSMTSDAVASTDALPAKANISSVPTSPAVTVEFPSEGFGVDETRLNPSAADRHNIDQGVEERDGLLLVLEDENHIVPGAFDSIVSTGQFIDSNPLMTIDFSSQPESRYGEEQVTDVGAMQEADSSSLNQIDKGGGTRMKGHGGLSNELSGTLGDHTSSDLGDTEAEEATHMSAQLSKPNDALSTDVAISDAEESQESHNFSSEPETPAVKFATTDQQREGHGRLSNELTGTSGDHMTSDSGDSEAVEATHAQLSKHDNSLSTVVAISNAEETQESHNLISELDSVPPEKSDATDQQREGISSGLLNEEKAELLDVSGGDGDGMAESIPASSGVIDDERSLELKIDDTEKPLGCKLVDLSSGLDGSLIRLSKLAEILQILEEDEFEFLFASRELSCVKFRDANQMNAISCFSHDAFERLKDQLYVTTLSKDAFHLELSEHQNLIDEISMTNASLNKVQSKNEILTEEIAQYRYELQEVVSAREELEKQLRVSKDEINAFSAEINELQQKLEMRQSDMSSLSFELVDCRNLMESLQAENQSLKGSFKLVTEEKDKHFEDIKVVLLENEKMKGELVLCKASMKELQKQVGSTENLTLLRNDMKRLEEEKDYIVLENSKLLNDVVEYRSEVESLRVENKILNETLTSVSDARKKLVEENELVVHQTEKLSNELMDCKKLVSTLEMEISNLNESLKTITEEIKLLEEEKKTSFLEYERQSQELAEMKVSEADLQAECCKAVNDIKEATSRINQLAEENEILKTNLEFSKSNIKVFGQQESPAKFEGITNSSSESEVPTQQKPKSYLSSPDQVKLNVYDDVSGFVSLKGHLEEAGTIVKKLEKAVESMHLYSHSLSMSNDKTVSAGVSKLIQAFESKGNADDHETEKPPSENQTTEDPYMMTKMLTKDLGALLMDIVMDSENASEFCKVVMQSKPLADAAGTELRSNYDALKDHTDQVEESSMELMILYEAMRENVSDAVAKWGELHILCDVMQKHELILKSENIQLIEKLNDFQVKFSGMQSQLDEICKNSEETVTSLSDKVKILQAEVANRQSIIEDERNSIVAQVLQTVGKLDAAVETFQSDSSASTGDNIDVVTHVASSVAGATKVIEDLQRQFEAAQIEHKAASDAYNNVFEKSSNLQVKNEMAENTLHILYNDLNELVSEILQHDSDETENVLVDDIKRDLLHPDGFETLLDQLKRFLEERMQLESSNKQLKSELVNNTRVIDEPEKQCLKVDSIMKFVEDIEHSLRKDGVEIYAHESANRLESLISLLFEKYKEAFQSLSLSTSLEMQLSELQGQVEHLNAMLVQYENENLVFKQSLMSAEEDAVSLNSKLREKMVDLEQSEQRVASLREKLSIAVTKGKGLISQRDSLKQSLVEMSKELEKSSQELLSKDASLHEIESKLEVYAEAGERMEALESELSYIRNSATALRESFLLKDSVLQRIEEILEDLELPEHLYTGDIIEKIDWLAKSVLGNSLPLNEWDQRSSVGVGSHSDAGIVGVDRVREEMKSNPNSSDDTTIRYEKLQRKFYELAQENEMLEQSLMERNYHVQRWEEILDRVDIPSQLRSLEPGDKIQWLESSLSESQNQCSSLQQSIHDLKSFCGSLTANLEDSQRRKSELDSAFQQACTEKDNQCSSFQQKIDNLENFCGSLTVNLEVSQRRISELDSDFLQACTEKETLLRDFEILRHDNDENSRKAADFLTRNENLQNEVNILQEQRLQMEEDIHHIEAAVKRLQELVMDALQGSITEDVVFDQEGVNYLEEMLRNLVEKYKALSSAKPVDIDPVDVPVAEKGEISHVSRDSEEQEVVTLRKKLEDRMGDLMSLTEEKDRYMLNNQSLLSEIEALDVAKNELQQLLSQEEQKSASLREKLNVAVRKGKSLVQQRDGMKQVIEELNAEVERLKSETNLTEKAFSEYEQRIKDLSASQERAHIMESENMMLRDQMAENERSFLEKEVSWNSMLDALGGIDVGVALNSGNPSEKLKELGKYLHDLCMSLDSAEQESRKSKRAAELLLVELNEVQERNDSLQEELAKVSHELSEVSREKDLAETAKFEALAYVEKLYIQLQEKDRQLSELVVLKSGVDQMREALLATERELDDVLSNDLEVLNYVEAMIISFMESHGNPELSVTLPRGFFGGVKSTKSENKVLTEIGSIRERLYDHSHLLHEKTRQLTEVVRNGHREYTSQKDSYESMKRHVMQLESNKKEKESELHVLCGNISLLHETCTSVILEVENWKNCVVGNALPSQSSERYFKSQMSIEEVKSSTNDAHIFTEKGIRGMREKLLLAVKDFMSMQCELMEDGQREMKSTLLDLQKQLQEKDIQRDRICMELVNQIKEAETTAKNYLHELQQVRGSLHDSQGQIVVMKEERKLLEQRMKELKDQETNSADSLQKINSLTDALAAKEQENEALMQALDEEEAQMEELANKIGTLENELRQKNQEMENIETSRSKALKKLSITVSKFDELHYLSENLLSEVEKLQSQLQERDGEISFLRQEVTRCTNDALAVTQMTKKRNSDEIHDVLTWLDSLISRVKVQDVTSDYKESHQVNEYREMLQKQIINLVSELENLRLVAQNNDMLLQHERTKVEEFAQKEQLLKTTLREKESQILTLQGAGDFVKPSTSEIVEVEQMKNNWGPQGTTSQQVRSLRKTNNDQVAIAIDMDQNSDRLEDDDDKAHGFKSLTTSKIVPRFTRPISDIVDGLWVSCNRALMRQPALRLCVIMYWAILHALLAFVV